MKQVNKKSLSSEIPQKLEKLFLTKNLTNAEYCMSLNKDHFHPVQSETLEGEKKGQEGKHSISTMHKIKPNAKTTVALLPSFFF